MALTVIDGGLKELERRLVKKIFRPTSAPTDIPAPESKMSDDPIRLTRREIKQLAGLTGSDPKNIRTRAQLDNFVRAHLINYPGRSPEEKLLRRMLESFLPDRLNGS